MDSGGGRQILWWIVVLLGAPILSHSQRDVFTKCGGTMRNPRGVITTPNFPHQYPVPINCRWVIKAPSDKVVAVYFTQFYMREGLRAAEYAYFSDSPYMGKTDFGVISSDREPTYLVSNKPVFVLDFVVNEQGNIHMRVRELLLDVFGFNITYEMIKRNESVREDRCLYHHCSFTGNCFATADFISYHCACFPGYFGEECQYDPSCGPTAARTMCQNGGTCRYYIGSTVRTCECPVGFEGAKCETKNQTQAHEKCTAYDCSCPLAPSNHHIVAENRSRCIRLSKSRYDIHLKLESSASNLSINLDDEFKMTFEATVQALLESHLERVENLSVIDMQPNTTVHFHFFGNSNENDKVQMVMEETVKQGHLGSFPVKPSYLELETEPALHIDSVEASERMPVVEGMEMTLACIVRASRYLKVEWFKDGSRVNVKTTHREMWTALVPKNSQNQLTSLLGFDRTFVLDSGEFTCRVTDWGAVQNKSIQISVLSAPKPRLSPLAASIHQGDDQVITCLSQDDVYGNFGYTWLKNGEILNPMTEPEMIEDLFPIGSRVLVTAAKASVTYTCIITSSAGATRKDSVITVLDKERSVPTCPAEEHMKVKWSVAASNTEDIQLCPSGYTGDVRRRCILKKGKGAVWKEPDFSGCLSTGFLAIKRKSDTLRLGYQLTDARALLLKLKKYLDQRKNKLQVAEGEPVVDLLEDIGAIKDSGKERNWEVFLDIVSFLLESPHLVKKPSKVVKLHKQVLAYGLLRGCQEGGGNIRSFYRPALVAEVGKIQPTDNPVQKFPNPHRSRSERTTGEDSTSWLGDSIEVDMSAGNYLNLNGSTNSPFTVAVVFYKNISSLLPERFLTRRGGFDLEYQLHSRLAGVAIQPNDSQLKMDTSTVSVRAMLIPNNITMANQLIWNISCGLADFSQRVQFSLDGCQLTEKGNMSICHCSRTGTYAVLLTTYSNSEQLYTQMEVDVIAGIGCAICAFLVCLTFLVLLVFWRKIQGSVAGLKLQLCIAVLGAYGAFLKAVHRSLPEYYHPHVVTTIQFFLLTAFSLQLGVGLNVYMECINLSSPTVKIAAIGWAVPIIVVGATLAAQALDGFYLDRWWLKFGSNFFYAYTVSVLILTVLQMLLYLTVRAEIRHQEKLDIMKKSKTTIRAARIRLLHCSLFITATLVLVSVSSILYTNVESTICAYFFSASSVALGFVIFTSYTIYSEKPFLLCCSHKMVSENIDANGCDNSSVNGSFKSFLKPERVNDNYTGMLEAKTGQRIDHTRRDNSKRTEDHSWREVSQLLQASKQNDHRVLSTIPWKALDTAGRLSTANTERCQDRHPKCEKLTHHYPFKDSSSNHGKTLLHISGQTKTLNSFSERDHIIGPLPEYDPDEEKPEHHTSNTWDVTAV